MEYRTLGRTGIKVSAIGLGTEYLAPTGRENIVAVIRAALAAGVNYIDTVFAYPDYRDALGEALAGCRASVVLPGHLGSAYKQGRDGRLQYQRTRNVGLCEQLLDDQLRRFATGYVDVLLLHNVNGVDEYQDLLKPKGLLALAQRMLADGRARSVGMTCHDIPAGLAAVRDGVIDVLMLPVNLAAHNEPGRKELFAACVAAGVAIVAMKPYAGGKLLQEQRSIYVGRYETGGQARRPRLPGPITPVKCLSYVLGQMPVATVVPGASSLEQLAAALAYLTADAAARDFAEALAAFPKARSGECCYCDHCLPCPVGIDIGAVARLVDMAEAGALAEARLGYARLTAHAAACNACGGCLSRCPFKVDIIGIMDRAVALFEPAAD